jgi:hypothetical protein
MVTKYGEGKVCNENWAYLHRAGKESTRELSTACKCLPCLSEPLKLPVAASGTASLAKQRTDFSVPAGKSLAS